MLVIFETIFIPVVLLFLLLFLRNVQVNKFRKRLEKGKICTFYIGEIRWMGEIIDFLEGTVSIRYFDGERQEVTERSVGELYP
ncbi:MAG: hypothetical protein WCI48_00550 [Bacteroidota bacterium]|jgi:hypothetical protein